jgi:hypothetical protein
LAGGCIPLEVNLSTACALSEQEFRDLTCAAKQIIREFD